ncbi:MAG: helix-turn-helix transcriptional regulator [Lachnospiraceae bacterium]|nr:helix-turn-helix transcriptional regulator [Lachnospiraceae bacterium]
MNTIGERIVFLREECDMSQKELAYAIDIAPTSLSRYENNLYEPKAEILLRLASVLDTTSDFLLGLSDTHKKPLAAGQKPPGITASEHQLLSSYRKLDRENQIRVLERIDTLLEVQAPKTQNPGNGK